MIRGIILVLFIVNVVIGTEIDFHTALKRNRKETIRYDNQVKISHTPSIFLSGEKGNVQLITQFSGEKNCQYELTAYVKGENLGGSPGNGAMILLNGNKSWLRITSSGEDRDTGNFDWKKIKTKFNTKFFKTGKINIYLVLRGQGKCWFDKISITKD